MKLILSTFVFLFCSHSNALDDARVELVVNTNMPFFVVTKNSLVDTSSYEEQKKICQKSLDEKVLELESIKMTVFHKVDCASKTSVAGMLLELYIFRGYIFFTNVDPENEEGFRAHIEESVKVEYDDLAKF